MIIFFEDGPLVYPCPTSLWANGIEPINVDAGMGYRHCRNRLKYIDENYPFNTEVYTNSLDAFSNYWCWDEEKNIPMIYIKDKNNNWKLINELTTRELRRGLALEKLYTNGEFANI